MGTGALRESEQQSDVFRFAMRRMAATVAILTTRFQHEYYGMTATAVNALSMDPPAILVAINQNASIHEPIARIGTFCVNLLGDNHSDLCAVFAGKLRGTERFAYGEWRNHRGMPMLVDAQANIFCESEKVVPYATHSIFVARVTEVMVAGDLNPLIYFDGKPQTRRGTNTQTVNSFGEQFHSNGSPHTSTSNHF